VNGGRILSVLALLAVAACTSDTTEPKAASTPSPSPSPSPTQTWFPSPTPTPVVPFELKPGSEDEARAMVRRALRFLVDEESGEYVVRAARQPGDKTFYTEEGTYSLAGEAFQLTRSYREGSVMYLPAFELTMRTIGVRRYLQMDPWPEQMDGCWIAYDPATTKQIVGVDVTDVPPYPVPVIVFSSTRVLGMSASASNVAQVTVPTVGALQMLGIPAPRVRALKVPWKMRTKATVTFVGGHLGELTIDGLSTLLDLKELDLNPMEYALIGDADAVASFYEVQAPVHVQAPPADHVVNSEKEADQGCDANQPRA